VTLAEDPFWQKLFVDVGSKFEDRGQRGNSLQANKDRQKTYPCDRASAAKNIFDKALAPLTVDECEDCIENREGTYPGH
jgi:hypothetical protein